ncbi:SDR family oxidoreductase [Myxosarcina sp. GI1]|uniref:SDR family oxidoreductase n=1 Tax=Myxosarcina sp. GI1 TaxID=1541065 RepID=UPI0005681933|nr:SDR family oxidoreductase [Myxosarcina sp. GI1]
MKYHEQHAIVTGGSSGIGKATARLLAQQGANITLIARDRLKLAAAKQEIEQVTAKTQRIITVAADVALKQEITEAIELAIFQLGTPSILIASAGIAIPNYFEELPLETHETSMAVNYFGSLYSIKAVLPTMERQGRGSIILISSGAGLIGIYGYSAYCPSKFAIRGLGETLRAELKPKGIQVSVVYPPDTDTPQLAAENKTKPPETKLITQTAATWTAEEVATKIVRGIELGRGAATPGWTMSMLYRFHSLVAPLLNWYFDRAIASLNRKH